RVPDAHLAVLPAGGQEGAVVPPGQAGGGEAVAGHRAAHLASGGEARDRPGGAGRGKGRAVRRPGQGDDGVLEQSVPGPVDPRRPAEQSAQARHARNPSFRAFRSSLRPMKTSLLVRGSLPQGRSGRPSKIMWTPWKTKRSGWSFMLNTPFMRK